MLMLSNNYKCKYFICFFQALSNCLPNSQTKYTKNIFHIPNIFKISGVCDLLKVKSKPLIVFKLKDRNS